MADDRKPLEKTRVASVDDFEEGLVRGFRVGGNEVAVVKRGDRFIAFRNLCTHSAYSFDHLRLKEDGTILCTGHYAVFDLDTGEPVSGPAIAPLPLFQATVEGGEVYVASLPT